MKKYLLVLSVMALGAVGFAGVWQYAHRVEEA